MLGLGLGLTYRRANIPAEGGGEEYEGPLDLVAGAVVAYGQRALSAAKRGTVLYTIREDAGDTTQSFSSDATTGAAPTASITTFLSGSDGFVTTWTDQSGNGDHISQATASDQPLWAASVQGGKPGFTCDVPEVNPSLSGGSVSLPDGAYTIFLVAGHGASAKVITDDYVELCVGRGGGNPFVEAFVDPSTASGAGDTAFVGDTVRIHDAAWQFGSRNYRVNGAAQTLSNDDDGSALGAISDPATLAMVSDGGAYLVPVQEMLIYSGILSDANRLAIRQNIATYYGITLS